MPALGGRTCSCRAVVFRGQVRTLLVRGHLVRVYNQQLISRMSVFLVRFALLLQRSIFERLHYFQFCFNLSAC